MPRAKGAEIGPQPPLNPLFGRVLCAILPMVPNYLRDLPTWVPPDYFGLRAILLPKRASIAGGFSETQLVNLLFAVTGGRLDAGGTGFLRSRP